MSPLPLTGVLLMAAAAVHGAAPDAVTIMQIQGREARSPLEGAAIITEGVITLCSRNGRQCWLQDPRGDGDPDTSDGVALQLRGHQGRSSLRPGDRVRLTGQVRERQFGNGLPLTEVTRVRDLTVLGRGHDLPAAVPITRLPDVSVTEAIAFWEALEGMRVQVAEAVAVSPTNRFGEFTVLAAANAQPGSGYHPSNHHLLLRVLPDGRVDYNPERIIVDDQAVAAPVVRPGDRFRALSGVVDYAFGNYKIQRDRSRHTPRAARTISEPSTVPGLRLTTFNLENLFDTESAPHKEDDRSTPSPEGLQIKLEKLARAVVETLALPDIIAVQEAENTAVLEALAARINQQRNRAYRAVSFESSDPRGIEVGLLWDSARVQLQRAAPLGQSSAFGSASASPGREPLVGEFEYRGRMLTVVVNHFKSKAGDDPLFGLRQPPHRPTEHQRKLQARAVRSYVDQRLRQDPQALIAVVGDLNDFPFAEPGEGADHPLALLRGGGPRGLADLSEQVPEAERYSFIYDGNSQLLDHILVSPALRPLVSAVRIAHINADFPAGAADDPHTPHRSSDHDPLTATLRLD